MDDMFDTHDDVMSHLEYCRDMIITAMEGKDVFFDPFKSTYYAVVSDKRDIEKILEIRNSFNYHNVAQEYTAQKEELYKEVASFCEERRGIKPEDFDDLVAWHYLTNLSAEPAGFMKDGEVYTPKVYIKVPSSRLIKQTTGLENYFNLLRDLIKTAIQRDMIREMKMPCQFLQYITRKDGCILYLNATNDISEFEEFLEGIYRVARKHGISDELRLTFGIDGEELSYSAILAKIIVELRENNPNACWEELTTEALSRLERYFGSGLGRLLKTYNPFRESAQLKA